MSTHGNHSIRDLVENELFTLGDPRSLRLEQFDEYISKIQDDEVFLALIEHFCYEKKVPMSKVISHLEKIIILWAFKKNACHLKKTADFLQVKPATLSRKLSKYQLDVEMCR